MPRVTLYVSDDLKAKMDTFGEDINWSAVAQKAFSEEMETKREEEDQILARADAIRVRRNGKT